MTAKELQAFVDRIEGDKAILLVGEERRQVILPAEYLPEGVGDGWVITLLIRGEPELTVEAVEDVSKLIQKLCGSHIDC